MLQGLIGRKVGMTQLFSEEGEVIPVTVLEPGPCWVVQKKTRARDGYTAVQLGFGDKKAKRTTKPLRGHFEKGGVSPKRWLREFRVDEQTLDELQEGQEISGEIFADLRYVDVTGTSKGRGFSGVMKRYGFRGKNTSHGTHESFRGRGAIGQGADPGRVFKNTRMAGQFGNVRVTVQNLQIVRFLSDQNLLLVQGAVPGPNGGMVLIRASRKQPLETGTR
ncbi:50S ribosomal protein L3 [Candidatus Entotheonellaceae bacterium PAL068K]